MRSRARRAEGSASPAFSTALGWAARRPSSTRPARR
jgi:hypothetical protein